MTFILGGGFFYINIIFFYPALATNLYFCKYFYIVIFHNVFLIFFNKCHFYCFVIY